ncbi:MAG TPA: IgGFc-binding protein, partial [Candidatus Kapabacteria bacterium]|nr:IgGFc-binding protein [Candidatus Kapabacteria bacterium]
MKNTIFFPRALGLLILLGCVFYGSSLFAQTGCGKGSPSSVTNKGKEFYIVFMQNEEEVNDVGNPSLYQHIFLASDDSDATVTVTCDAFPNNVDTFHLNKGQSTEFKISEKYPNDDYIVQNSGVISKKAIHIVSTSPIVCYGMNHKALTADAFLALPLNVVETGLTYKVLSYPNSHAQDLSVRVSEFAVAAFRDSTLVTITPTAKTSANVRNVPFSVLLMHGECIQYQADVVGNQLIEDLTGSDIVANQPIAVYGGHQRTEVPFGGVFNSRDHLAESIAPFATWGREFIVAGFVDSGNGLSGGELRIVSGSNDNTVTFGGNITTPSFTLQSGEHRDVTIAPGTIASVKTTQPSLLGIMSNSTSKGSGGGIGDPFLAIIPSVDQLYTDYTYFVSTDPVYQVKNASNNFLLVVTEMTGVGALVLTDSTGKQYTPAIADYSPRLSINGTSYSVLWFQHPIPGLWHIHTPNIYQRGINILAYGFGNVDSYGYTAGGLYVPKNGIVQIKKNAAAPYPGAPQVPVFGIQNVLGVPVYLDSMTITYSSNPEN